MQQKTMRRIMKTSILSISFLCFSYEFATEEYSKKISICMMQRLIQENGGYQCLEKEVNDYEFIIHREEYVLFGSTEPELTETFVSNPYRFSQTVERQEVSELAQYCFACVSEHEFQNELRIGLGNHIRLDRTGSSDKLLCILEFDEKKDMLSYMEELFKLEDGASGQDPNFTDTEY